MKPSGLCDLEITDYTGAEGEPRMRLESPSTGLLLDANASNQVDDFGQQPHATRIVQPTDDAAMRPLPGLGFEASFFPESTTMPGLSAADSAPPKDVHQTGGPNRCFAARAAHLLIRGLTPAHVAKGLAYLRAWVTAELTNRPLAHGAPRVFLESLKINPGTAVAWDADKKTGPGWNAYDVAHAHWSYEALLGMHGDHLGTACFALKWSWFTKAHPPQSSFWDNQGRAVALALENAVFATELGFGRGDDGGEALQQMFGGNLPKRMLNDYARVLIQRYGDLQREWQRDLDDRKLKILNGGKDWNGHGPQLQGQYTPMDGAQLIFGMAKAILSGLLQPQVAADLTCILCTHALFVVRGARDPASAKLGWAFGTTDFPDRATVEKAIADAVALGYPRVAKDGTFLDDPYEAAEVEPGKWRLRKRPKLQDAEMLCAALRAADAASQVVQGVPLVTEVTDYVAAAIDALPALDTPLYNQSSKAFSRYLGVAYALEQAATTTVGA